MSSHTNRLIQEKSPYLLQHAHDYVDWFPWGQEAFDAAKDLKKPIFLSIGYATCHWCHVMEKESFSDVETAKLLNEVFINVKVDREELPDVDNVYMGFAQVFTDSSLGWPLNVILTPDLKPFFAITYLPPNPRKGLLGLNQFIQKIKQLWQSEEKQALIEQTEHWLDLISRQIPVGKDLPSHSHMKLCAEKLYQAIDPVYGGMQGEPKFPLSYQLSFLLLYSQAHSDSRALFCAEVTLVKMFQGGIYDHIGGGFSRYAIDRKWRIPHFEKMLFDNALLAKAYLDAWKYTKNLLYQRVCCEVLDYLLRESKQSIGGFSSAEDADSQGEEGAYYLWTEEEIVQELPLEQQTLFCQLYNVTPEGNFDGKNILHLTSSFEEFAEKCNLDWQDIMPKMEWARHALFQKRSSRPKPFKDDKVITAWNGLAIDAYVKAGVSYEKQSYIKAAEEAAEFVYTHLWNDGRLSRRWREGESRFLAYLDDYAFMIKAALSLFEEGRGAKWLKWSIEMADVLKKQYKQDEGAFYFSDKDQQFLLSTSVFNDGSEPAGNSVHAENLLKLYQITMDETFLKQAEDILKAAKAHIEIHPLSSCYMQSALARYLDTDAATVVIVLNVQEMGKREIQQSIHSVYNPHLQAIWMKENDPELKALAPWLADKVCCEGQTTVYVCTRRHCRKPLVLLDEIVHTIREL